MKQKFILWLLCLPLIFFVACEEGPTGPPDPPDPTDSIPDPPIPTDTFELEDPPLFAPAVFRDNFAGYRMSEEQFVQNQSTYYSPDAVDLSGVLAPDRELDLRAFSSAVRGEFASNVEGKNVKILFPSDFKDEKELEAILNDPSYLEIWWTLGSYIHGGRPTITISGSPNQPRIWRYYDPQAEDLHSWNTHVYDLEREKEAVLLALDFQGSSYNILDGLTFREGGTGRIAHSSNYNIINRCKWLDIKRGAAWRIVDSHYNLVQFNYFQGAPDKEGVDCGGVGIYAMEGQESIGNIITANEAYGLGDFIGVPYNQGTHPQTGTVSRTRITYNYIYVDEDYYYTLTDEQVAGTPLYSSIQYSQSEDGIDVKNGTSSTNIADWNIIEGNIIRGFRPSGLFGGSGSTGCGILLHNDTQGWIVRFNIIDDCTCGIHVKFQNPRWEETKTRNIHIVDNLINGSRLPFLDPDNPGDFPVDDDRFKAGTGLRTEMDSLVFVGNTIANCDRAFAIHNTKAHVFATCNLILECEDIFQLPETKRKSSFLGLNTYVNTPFDPENIPSLHPSGDSKLLPANEFKTVEGNYLGDLVLYGWPISGRDTFVIRNVIPTERYPGAESLYPAEECSCDQIYSCPQYWQAGVLRSAAPQSNVFDEILFRTL